MSDTPPCVLFEDEHLLVVNKPAGMNTHAPSPFAGEGIYDWLHHREPRWASLAIIHRLDKETSGLIVLAKTTLANRSLTQQFTDRSVRKKYWLLTDRTVRQQEFTAQSRLVRLGDRYVSRPGAARPDAETRFCVFEKDQAGRTIVQAVPVTGRTHQIRVHAADHGFPILGDAKYGGGAYPRVCLHAGEMTLRHPADHSELRFKAEPDFNLEIGLALREALIAPDQTNSYRLVHGDSDRSDGWYVDRFGPFLLSTSANDPVLTQGGRESLEAWRRRYQLLGVYQKQLHRRPGMESAAKVSPRHLFGEVAPAEFVVLENGVRFALSFQEGYSVGLFLDQRDNRRRLLSNHLAADFSLFRSAPEKPEVLNAFAYTCSFSVCAARAGVRTTSLDLSQKYLEWGKRNFRLNSLDPSAHDFIYGDAFDWMRRLAKKQRAFDLIILDPPTFSRSKEHGTFRAEEDFGCLVTAVLPLLRAEGVLFASSNAAALEPEDFLRTLREAVNSARRTVKQLHYFPQPPDFPMNREEPGYLKTVWMRIG